jgi:hypothetical protein
MSHTTAPEALKGFYPLLAVYYKFSCHEKQYSKRQPLK